MSPVSNGHKSPLSNTILVNDVTLVGSDSDLSEIHDSPIIEAASPATSSTPQHQSDFGHQDLTSSEESEVDNPNGSEDAEFDMDDSPVAATAANGRNGRNDRSTSHDSRRPPKRKVGHEIDEDIMANPELYGLRRSVGLSSPRCSILLIQQLQARPVQHRTIVS
jgi:chromodomain-helicase-DNA-binding protein 1